MVRQLTEGCTKRFEGPDKKLKYKPKSFGSLGDGRARVLFRPFLHGINVFYGFAKRATDVAVL